MTQCATFKSLGLDTWLVQQCTEMGLKQPTEIQQNCIPEILHGRDCLGCAKTGSGKTAAFALPILQKLSEEPYGIFGLVLTPTRELAIQIAEQFRALGKSMGLRDCLVIGGLDMVKQGMELGEQPHIVIATPGRLAGHLSKPGVCSLDKIQFLVLDEADRLLESSFEPDLGVIFNHIPAKRQTLVFSATLTDTVHQLMKVAKNSPYVYQVKSDEATVSELDQRYILMAPQVKDCYLAHILKEHAENKQVIIFTQTCRSCQVITNTLRKVEFKATGLHSIMKQQERIASLAKFRTGVSKILVATDVASRGLDIAQVQLVINFNVPASATDYIHRVGRTARAGRGGMALTVVTQHDIARLQAIEEHVGVKMKEFETSEAEAVKLMKVISVVKREVEIRLNENGFADKRMNNKIKHMTAEEKKKHLLAKKNMYKQRKKKKRKTESGEQSTEVTQS